MAASSRPKSQSHPCNYSWAERMKRVSSQDVSVFDRSGGSGKNRENRGNDCRLALGLSWRSCRRPLNPACEKRFGDGSVRALCRGACKTRGPHIVREIPNPRFFILSSRRIWKHSLPGRMGATVPYRVSLKMNSGRTWIAEFWNAASYVYIVIRAAKIDCCPFPAREGAHSVHRVADAGWRIRRRIL